MTRDATVSRRTLLAGAAAGTAVVVAGAGSAGAHTGRAATSPGLVIVSNGTAKAIVVTPDAPDQQVLNAVGDLCAYVRRATGAELPVVPVSDDPGSGVRVYVGLAAPNAAGVVAAALRTVGADGFVIQPVASTVSVLGPTARGTRYGVYEFLERYVDVRWLLPGPLGEDVPEAPTIRVDRRRVRDAPAMLMRHCSPYTNGILDTSTSADINFRWGAHLRSVRPVDMGHNLYNVIKISKWRHEHPEFFPILTEGGDPVVPPDGRTSGWQPRFTAEGIAQAAADEILEALRADPNRTSFSLGVNDNYGFSIDTITDEFNSVGLRSASVAYYRFVNEVAELVAAEFPQVILGLLAYTQVADPPPFELRENVVPFLTRDRTCWITPEGEELDRRTTLNWLAVARHVGWYDYQTGGAFLAPRVDSLHAARAYRFAADVGVRYVYAECHARWAEGAKQWIYSKLLWDPDADVERLRREWSERLVGSEAAGDLVGFQEIWAKVWSEDIARGEWIKLYGRRYNYMYFTDPGYLADVEVKDVHEARRLLDRVSASVTTPIQRDRADLLQRAFEYVEASTLSYPRPAPPPVDAGAAIDQLDAVTGTLDRNITMAARRQEWINENRADPLFGSAINLRTQGIQWSGWNLYPLWDIAAFIARTEPGGGPVRRHVQDLAARAESPNVRWYAAYLLAAADDTVHHLGSNLSFDDDDTRPWVILTETPPPEPIAQSTEVRLGDSGRSLRVGLGFGEFSVTQRVAVQPGPLRGAVHYFVGGDGHPADAAARPSFNFFNAAGSQVEIIRGRTQSLENSMGAWRTATLTDLVPDDAVAAELQFKLFRTDQSSNVVYIDAVEFTHLPRPT